MFDRAPELTMKYFSLLKITFLALALSLSVASVADEASSEATPQPVALVQEKTEVLLGTLSKRKNEFDEDPAALVTFARDVALSHWDLTRTSRMMLGKYWRTASDEQKSRFEEEFLRTMLRYVVRAYGFYDDSLVEILSYDWQSTSKKGSSGWVRSKVKLPARIEVAVDYRMNYAKEEWKLIDVRVEGISLVNAKRNEYRSVIRDKGLDYLIQAMYEKNQEVLAELDRSPKVSLTSE